MSATISLIIPVYGTEKYLRRCIESVINQNYKELEIILVNDCSPGNAEEIILEYQQENNIKLCYVAADEYINDNLVVKCEIEDRNKYKGEVPYLVIGSEE